MNRALTFSLLLFTLLVTACQPNISTAGIQQPGPAPTETIIIAIAETAVPTTIPSPIPTHQTDEAYPSSETSKTNEPTPTYSFEIINSYPHDPAAFTQGLVYLDGILYEGTGRYGQSSLRQVNLETGDVLMGTSIPEQYFGEGITIFDDKIYQLTWKNQIGFIYDQESFDLLDTFTYPTEGWGLTHDDDELIMSDGTNNLYFLDPHTLEITGNTPVNDEHGNPVYRLNELEYIDGEVYANIWQTNLIARIDPESGQVKSWIDLTTLLSPETLTQPVDHLNGIAHDAENGRLFVTGKLWPTLFEIKLIETAVSFP